MKNFFACLFCFLLSVPGSAQQNTVLIIGDDLGADYLGFYPNTGDTAVTPVLRSLLPQAVLFESAWANPLCSPTRAGIFTGKYAFRTGIGSVITGSTPQLDTAEMSLAKLLRDYSPQRYATANVGKWHLHTPMPIVRRTFPNYMGYDLYSGNFNGAITDYFNWVRIKNGVLDTVTTYATTQTVNDAIAWLDTLSGTKPFFLWLAFNAPHSPYHKPPDSLISQPGLPGTPAHIAANRPLYFKAAIEAMDTEIGRLLNYLDQNGLRDSTNIIFIGDNGNDRPVAQISDTTHLKGSVYEYGVHVPMFVSGPSVVDPGRTNISPVSTTDLFATILELSGFTNWYNYIPASRLPIDARSLMPIIRNDSSGIRNWIFTEVFTIPALASDAKAIRDTTFKLIRFDNGAEEFYNVVLDSMEQQNLPVQFLDSIELYHYNTLCNELNALVGSPLCQTVVSSANSIFDRQDVFAIFPNPGYENVRIETGENADALVCLYESSGRLIRQGRQGKWDLSGLEPGTYYFSFSIGSRTCFKKYLLMH